VAVSCPADTPNDVHKQLRLSQLQVKDQVQELLIAGRTGLQQALRAIS
jgi:hypothetical protein